MAPSIYKVLNVATISLSTQRSAINVASHNIANANTEGFSRQKAVLGTNTPTLSDKGYIGSGASVVSIERVTDKFLGIRISSEMEEFGKLEQQTNVLGQVEAIFNDSDDIGLNKTINDFFNSWSLLSNNASKSTSRTEVIGKANTMVSTFNKMDYNLESLRNNVNKKIKNSINEINNLTSGIAKLNTQIHQSELGLIKANDLRDERDKFLKHLSQKVNIDYFEDQNNIVNVVTSNGFSLVESLNSFDLATGPSSSDPSISNILWEDKSGNYTNITSEFSSGELAGLVDLRDNTIEEYRTKLGGVASAIINEVNMVHSTGYALDGESGINFFTPVSSIVTKGEDNTGTSSVTSSIADPAALLRDDYKITLTSSNTFTLQNTTRKAASGTFTFTAGTSFALRQGISINITGAGNAGDTFEISVNKSSSKTISVNSLILNNMNKIAASESGEIDDGSVAQSISDIQNKLLISPLNQSSISFNFTIQDFYSSIVSEVGAQTKRVGDSFVQQEGVLNQLNNLNDSVSAVNIDEEMIKIIQFQRSYEASARLVNIVDQMLVTILESL